MAQLKALRVTERTHEKAKRARKIMAYKTKGEITSINAALEKILDKFIEKNKEFDDGDNTTD